MKNTRSMTEYKREAGTRAAALVTSGQRVGLGTGSTAAFAIEELGRRVRDEDLSIQCVATSFQSTILARQNGLPVYPALMFDELDISIDGADEIDPGLTLIKGGGGAHTMEKIVHAMSRRFVVVADDSKRVDRLGISFPIPIEVIPASVNLVEKRLYRMNARDVVIRMGEKKDGPIVSDNGNFIVDAFFEIEDAEDLEKEINGIPGVVENGIFSHLSVRVERAIIAGPHGLEEIVL